MSPAAATSKEKLKLSKALSAYLDPLLKKHEEGKLIVYEDLLSSWKSCQSLVQGDKELTQRLQKLHDSQIQAYTQAAQKELSEFARKFPLPPIESDTDEIAYVKRVNNSLSIPDWKVNHQFVRILVQKRASQHYQLTKTMEKSKGKDDDAVVNGQETKLPVEEDVISSVEDDPVEDEEDDEEDGDDNEDDNDDNDNEGGKEKHLQETAETTPTTMTSKSDTIQKLSKAGTIPPRKTTKKLLPNKALASTGAKRKLIQGKGRKQVNRGRGRGPGRGLNRSS